MKQKIAIVVALMVVGLLAGAAAVAQNAAPPSLKEQLEAQYKLAKVRGNGTVDPGTVLVIQMAGIQGVPLGDLAMAPAIYKDGVLHPPSKKSSVGASLLQASTRPTSETSGKEFRPFPVGDKVYVSRIDVNIKNDRIGFVIVECAECNGVSETSPYKAAVSFQFAKGYLETANVPDVEDTIAKVIPLDTATAGAQPAQPEPQPEQPAAQSEQPPAPAGPPALTNDDIIKLVQVKLADSLIITKIKSSACAFDTSADGLVRLKQAGVSDAVLQAMLEGGGQPMAAPAQPAPPAVETPPAPACGDYAACLASGTAAISASQWDRSLADLQKASNLDPSKPEAWTDLGCVYLAIGQQQNAIAMWEKALGLAGTVTFGVWHYGGLHGYEMGTFHLGAKEVSFVLADGKRVFSVAPTEVSSVKSHHPPLGGSAWSFGMKVAGRNYWFSYVPLGVQCETPIRCNDPAGYDQEGAVSNYVAQTIGKLAPGSLGQ
ncbi:MAG: hypothetical protein ABSA41_04135 [Terriglobia bacterium]